MNDPPGAMAGTSKSNPIFKDEVDEILKGLNLDKEFFTQKLSSDRAQKLLPSDGTNEGRRNSGAKSSLAPAVGTGFRRRPSMVARRFPDFDVYLTESLMPVLAQALDALGRQVSKMQQQGDRLDAKVRARFNPITWLAQQLLRRHPRVATTPRSFHSWADQERGRRELLRSRAKVLEIFNGFMQNGVVGRNTLPFVVAAVDDTFFLRGTLKDDKSLQEEIQGSQGTKRPAANKRHSNLGGDIVTFEQFWFKLANVIVKHDDILLTTIQEGRRQHKLREEEQARALEAARLEEERRLREAAEHGRLKKIYSELLPRMRADEALQGIQEGKMLTGEFLKQTDPEFESQVAPHGPHVILLQELLVLFGLEIQTENDSLELEAADDGGSKLFRQKVNKHEKEKEAEKEPEKEAPKEKEKRGKKKQSKESTEESAKGSKDEAPEEAPKEKVRDRWWDPAMKSSWKILQAACGVEHTGHVDSKVLKQVLAGPDPFIALKKKVDLEVQRRAENGVKDEEEEPPTVVAEQKPTMEELSLQYRIPKARLQFFHDLFESFLPPKEDGTPGVCGYPANPATINKKTMWALLKQIQDNLVEAEFEARFRRIDGDGSGLIEFDEFVQWVHDDEVEVVSGAEKVKRTFEELADDMDVSVKLIMYVYDCFKFELGPDQVDEYPTTCASFPRDQAYTLAQILVQNLDKKKFDRYWSLVDVNDKGSVTFDDFCELLDFEDMPEEVLAKYNSED
ncbi:unnamed protein product [Effrenium voratum]|uniref:EF-hand domain-containing protein n=1 Tax=Effrenium voratum TaxID=2562239 RepID=A0AA36I355_9DINO|nr:unnamed protein product [Effrenium voratum]